MVRVPFPAACVAIKRLFCVAKGGSAGCFDPIAAGLQRLSHRGISPLHVEERARRRKGVQVAGQRELVHAAAVRANMRSILVAMMKSFSCSPLIFLVGRETVALTQPKLIFG